MIFYMTEVINREMGMDYTSSHEKLMSFIYKIDNEMKSSLICYWCDSIW